MKKNHINLSLKSLLEWPRVAKGAFITLREVNYFKVIVMKTQAIDFLETTPMPSPEVVNDTTYDELREVTSKMRH